ncbi:unnamed protein product, partial [Amoebophrya sp. A120]
AAGLFNEEDVVKRAKDATLRDYEQQQAASELLLSRLADHQLSLVPVGDDGNCMFRAIAHAVLGSEERHGESRAAAVAQLRQSPETYRRFLSGPDVDWNSYTAKMEQDKTWGDQVCLAAAATHYDCVFTLITNYDDPAPIAVPSPVRGLGAQRKVTLAYWAGVHYGCTAKLPSPGQHVGAPAGGRGDSGGSQPRPGGLAS